MRFFYGNLQEIVSKGLCARVYALIVSNFGLKIRFGLTR